MVHEIASLESIPVLAGLAVLVLNQRRDDPDDDEQIEEQREIRDSRIARVEANRHHTRSNQNTDDETVILLAELDREEKRSDDSDAVVLDRRL